MMNNYEKIYQELGEKYTDKEIAESMLIPATLTPEERQKSDEALLAFRSKLLREQTEAQRIFSDLMKLRFQIEDYVENEDYLEEKGFGKYLERYGIVVNKSKKKLSEDLNIHYTRLSQIINGRVEPNIKFLYRLEAHSANLIPAFLWWKLANKKQEYLLKKPSKIRIEEASKVKNAIKAI